MKILILNIGELFLSFIGEKFSFNLFFLVKELSFNTTVVLLFKSKIF